IHLESSIVVDHDHVIAPPEMGIPAPRLERRLYVLDVRCAARYPVDVPETHRSLVVAQNLVRRNPGAPDLQPVDDSRILEALTDHAPVKLGFFMRHAEFGAVQRLCRARPRRFACVLLHQSPGTRAGTWARYARWAAPKCSVRRPSSCRTLSTTPTTNHPSPTTAATEFRARAVPVMANNRPV